MSHTASSGDQAGSAATAEDPFFALVESTAGSIGDEFLAALVRNLRTVAPISFALIGERVGEPPIRARALFSWDDGAHGQPFEYALEGAPCKHVYGGQVIVVPEQLSQRFPKEGERYQSYCGVPLYDGSDLVVGHFAVFADAPLVDPRRIEGIMRIFGMRIEAELRRRGLDAERERLIARINAQHRLANQANQLKSQVLGMVAHDLRNPLAAISSRAELVETLIGDGAPGIAALPPASLELLRKCPSAIRASVERMETMIADLLEMARREATSITLRRHCICIGDAVAAAIELSAAAAATKGIVIQRDGDGAFELTADEGRLVEALDNMISNAVKFSAHGAVVTVTTAALVDENAAVIEVSDQGPGLDADDLAHAFTQFRTLSARPTGGESSTGMGLAIVRSIAEAHGGVAEAHSAGKGAGARFRLRLPLGDDAI